MFDSIIQRLAKHIVVAFITNSQVARIIRIMNENDKIVLDAITKANSKLADVEVTLAKISAETATSLEQIDKLKALLAEAQSTPESISAAIDQLHTTISRIGNAANNIDAAVVDPTPVDPTPVDPTPVVTGGEQPTQ